MAVAWLLAAVIMAITIVGLPWARAAFNIVVYTLLPFGQTAVSRDAYTGHEHTGYPCDRSDPGRSALASLPQQTKPDCDARGQKCLLGEDRKYHERPRQGQGLRASPLPVFQKRHESRQ